MPQKNVKGGNDMNRLEKKMAKKIVALFKKNLGWKTQVIVNSKNKDERHYDILVTNHKDGIFYLVRAYANAVALLNHNLKDTTASAKVVKVLYDFLIA
jgi:hypothetical protein